MTADQLADASAEIGTTVAPTGFTTTPQRFARGLAIAGEMLMHPLLDQPGIDRRKALQSALARRIAQMPITVPRHVFYAELYGASDPSVRSLVPTEASVAAITRDDVARFYDAHIRPDATTIVVAGDLRDADALAHVTRVFGRWARRASTAAKPAPAVVQRSPTTIYLHDVPGTQAYLYVGDAGPTRSSPDFYSVETAAAISGLRMQQALRERRAFMYSGNTGMVWRPSPQASAFVGSTSVNATKADSALVEWIALLRGLRGDQPATTRELDAVRASRVGVIPERIDGPDSLAARIVEMVRERLPFDYFDTYARHMASVTAAGVAAAASRYIDLDHLVIVVTGDRASLEPALRAAKIAPVVIVDANGKPIDR